MFEKMGNIQLLEDLRMQEGQGERTFPLFKQLYTAPLSDSIWLLKHTILYATTGATLLTLRQAG